MKPFAIVLFLLILCIPCIGWYLEHKARVSCEEKIRVQQIALKSILKQQGVIYNPDTTNIKTREDARSTNSSL